MLRKTSCCIHVLIVNNYFPELTKLTLPTIEVYANKINASLNIITERKFKDWPILTEKLQVYDYPDFDWNILMDADILIHPDTPDPLFNFNPRFVGIKDDYKASMQFKIDKYFIRDGRNLGVSGCLVCTSRLTHDLWKFISDLNKEEIMENILQDRKCVDEYTISRNVAKYGLKHMELFPVNYYNMLYHLGIYEQDQEKCLDVAKNWLKLNWR